LPTNEVRAHLAALYAGSDDPWSTHESAHEQMKFARTMASLPQPRYRRCLEAGCGAGALTALLATRCDALVAMDCTSRALAVAKGRTANADVDFIEGAAPGNWSEQPPDLVVLSEVLYFLTDDESAGLALRLALNCAQGCDVVLVNWLGDTDGAIGGAAAAHRLIRELTGTHRNLTSQAFDRFRIDDLRRRGHVVTVRVRL